MSKVAIVYWSGTGNTEAMAQAVQKGVQKGGAEAELFQVEQFSANDIAKYDGMIFGCPAMGDEVLEESVFEPFFAEAEGHLKDVPTALFGSYGWGGGAWMKAWEERVKADGAKLLRDGLAIENTPDDDGLAQCEALGEEFAKSF